MTATMRAICDLLRHRRMSGAELAQALRAPEESVYAALATLEAMEIADMQQCGRRVAWRLIAEVEAA